MRRACSLLAATWIAGALAPRSTHAEPRGSTPEAAVFLDRALSDYHAANFKDSVSDLDKAVALAPDWKTPVAFRSIARWTSGDSAGARDDASIGVTIADEDAESLTARCLAKYVMKDMDGAEKDCLAAVRKDKNTALGYFGLGSIFSSIGQPQASLAPISKCLQLQPQSALCFVVRGTVQDKLKHFDKAADDYGRVLDNAPQFYWAYLFRGKDYRELKKYDQAEADFTRFLDKNAQHEDALYMRGNVRYFLGDFAGTVKDLDRVIELNPSHGLAYSNRGLARARLGDRQGAVDDLKKALELAPEKRQQIEAAIAKIESEPATKTR